LEFLDRAEHDQKNKVYLMLGKLIRTRVIPVAIGPPQGNKKCWIEQTHVLKGSLKLHILFNVKIETEI